MKRQTAAPQLYATLDNCIVDETLGGGLSVFLVCSTHSRGTVWPSMQTAVWQASDAADVCPVGIRNGLLQWISRPPPLCQRLSETLRYSVLRGDGRVDGFLSPRGNGFFSRSACAEAMTSRSSEPEQSQSSPIVCVAPPIGSATPRTTPRSPRPRRQQIRKSDETEIGVTGATMLRSSCSGMASGDPITYASPQRNRRPLRMVAVEASAWT